MKPNDKAIEAARAESKRWQEGLNRPENQIPCWKVLREADDGYDGYDVIAKFNSREERDEALERFRAEAMVTAAYAAQFQSEDYAGLVKELRSERGCIASSDDCLAAAEAIEMLLAKLNNKPKPSEDYAGLVKELRKDISDPNGKMMSDWDSWRKYIASGGDSSWPRDQFEGHLNAIAEIHHSLADALEAVLVERDTYKNWLDYYRKQFAARVEELVTVSFERDALKAELAKAQEIASVQAERIGGYIKTIEDRETERDAALAEIDAISSAIKSHRYMDPPDGGSVTIAEQVARMWEDNEALRTERDALLARLAPVEAIENDKDDPTREYIPLPGGWEIQTKGKGSSYRLLDKKTGERHMILAGDAPFVHEFVTRMAKEINAAAEIRSGK